MRGLPSALAHLDDIGQEITGRHPVIFLDYDGTLSPIVPDPDMALLDAGMRAVLARLAGLVPVLILSGRDLADVEAKVGLPGLHYAGSHGFDLHVPDGSPVGDAGMPAFDRFAGSLAGAARALADRLTGIPGVRIEEKRFAVTVHFRQVEESRVLEVVGAVEQVGADFDDLRITTGKKILELRPDIDWDKGRALEWLLAQLGLEGPDVVPFYLGDDITDEDGFRALAGRGIGIVVGREDRATAADYALDDTAEARAFLEWVADVVEAA